ncbi:MAG: VTT domain-containing protein [Chloroflexota bacterium]
MSDATNTAWYVRRRGQLMTLALWLVIGISTNVYMRMTGTTALELVNQVTHLFMDNWYGPLLYVIAYVLRPFTFLPGTPFTIFAGYVFGFWWGLLYAMIAGILSVSVPYATGRWFSDRDQLEKMLVKRSGHMTKLIRTMRDNPFQTTLTTRFLYLPYDLVNFAAGSLHIPVIAFVSATLIGNLIPAIVMVNIGASIETRITEGRFDFDPLILIISALIWLGSYVISRIIKRREAQADNTETYIELHTDKEQA